jgi:hypothetical protein
MTNTELNYSTAEPQNSYSVIPDKTLAKVRMHIKKGYYNDESKGWTEDFATKSDKTNAVYLNCEYTVINGKYNGRKVWSLIGLHSEKGDKWNKIGASFIRTVLESANGIDSNDKTDAANKARTIKGFQELHSIEFVAQINVSEDQDGKDRNEIKYAITKEHKEYDALMDLNGRHKIAKKSSAPEHSVEDDDEIPF